MPYFIRVTLYFQKMASELSESMSMALVQDRVDFVQLFLDSGVELKKFLTVKRLRDLYDDVSLIFYYSRTPLKRTPWDLEKVSS